jgi:hypothetical protein
VWERASALSRTTAPAASTGAELLRVERTDTATVLKGVVGAADTGATTATGLLLSAPDKVFVAYQGSLYLFKSPAQLAADGYAGTAAVPVPGPAGLNVVPS